MQVVFVMMKLLLPHVGDPLEGYSLATLCELRNLARPFLRRPLIIKACYQTLYLSQPNTHHNQ